MVADPRRLGVLVEVGHQQVRPPHEPGGPVAQRQLPPALAEPGDLIVELAALRALDRPRRVLELARRSEARAGERLPVRVIASVDVEVAECDQVAPELVTVVGPVSEPLGERGELRCAVPRLAVDDVPAS